MGLIETSGTVTTTTSEVTIIDSATLNSHALYLFLDQLVAGDLVQIKLYIYDVYGAVITKSYRTQKISGPVTDPCLYIPFMPTSEFKVTIQKLAGSNYTHNYNHETY